VDGEVSRHYDGEFCTMSIQLMKWFLRALSERRLMDRSAAGYSPSGARHSSRSLDCAAKDDELDTINHRGASTASYERLNKRLEGVHVG